MKKDLSYNQIPENMERVQRILKHPEFETSMSAIRALEKERIFCCHGIAHLLDVARIAYIMSLEEEAGLKKDMIYAAGLLHDVGKYLQYMNGTPHHISSAEMGERILADAGYDADEITVISYAIRSHRDQKAAGEERLSWILYRADKLSRACYACPVSSECNWSEEKKTTGVIS